MTGYGLMVAICIVIPIAAGIWFTNYSMKLRLSAILGLTFLGVMVYIYLPILDLKLESKLEEKTSYSVRGDLNSTQVGCRVRQPGAGQSTQAGQGEVLILFGWMETSLGDGTPPSIFLESTNGKIAPIIPKVAVASRPDVTKYFSDPAQEKSGFQAEIRIPDALPLGFYHIRIDREQSGSKTHYYPKDKIEIITSAAGAELQKAEEMKLHPPSPSATITQVNQPKKNKLSRQDKR